MDGFEQMSYNEAFEYLMQHHAEATKRLSLSLEAVIKVNRIDVEEAKVMVEETVVEFADDVKLKNSLRCFILHKLHDHVMAGLYRVHEKEDQDIFEKCKAYSRRSFDFHGLKISKHVDVPVPASIVELASLDGRKTPADKLQCLCSCYDLIYAELKLAIIETTEDNNIPCLDNEDIIPVLIKVIVAARPKHLRSNLVFTRAFLGNQGSTSQFIHQQFELAYEYMRCDHLEMKGPRQLLVKEWDQSQFHEMYMHVSDYGADSLQGLNMRRITSLITQSHASE